MSFVSFFSSYVNIHRLRQLFIIRFREVDIFLPLFFVALKKLDCFSQFFFELNDENRAWKYSFFLFVNINVRVWVRVLAIHWFLFNFC